MNDDTSSRTSRLSRWSKRKIETQEDAAKNKAGTIALTSPDALEKQKEIALTRQQNLDTAEAIDFEALDFNSDFSVFMKDGVPEALRRKAYRLLWKTNPLLANLDGLNDYDEDFADVSLIMKTFQSAWDVGKGYPKPSIEIPDDALVTEPEPEPLMEPENTAPVETEAVADAATVDQEEEQTPALIDDTQISAPITAPPEKTKVSLRRRLLLEGPSQS